MAEDLAAHSPNVIFVDSNPDGSQYSSVVHNLEAGTKEIVDYLKQMGHEHISFIRGQEYLGSTQEIHFDIREKHLRRELKRMQT